MRRESQLRPFSAIGLRRHGHGLHLGFFVFPSFCFRFTLTAFNAKTTSSLLAIGRMTSTWFLATSSTPTTGFRFAAASRSFVLFLQSGSGGTACIWDFSSSLPSVFRFTLTAFNAKTTSSLLAIGRTTSTWFLATNSTPYHAGSQLDAGADAVEITQNREALATHIFPDELSKQHRRHCDVHREHGKRRCMVVG